MPDSSKLRPSDLARPYGLSTQAIRNYEAGGILPPSVRSPHGYRHYSHVHVSALAAFVQLTAGYDRAGAAEIMQSVNGGDIDFALRVVEARYDQQRQDRDTAADVEIAVARISELQPRATDAVTIGVLAHRLGLRAATIRKWEAGGILSPTRDSRTGYRMYDAAAVRDAHLALQLRRGGYGIARIAEVVDQWHETGQPRDIDDVMRRWFERIGARSRSMIKGAGALDNYLEVLDRQRLSADDSAAHSKPIAVPWHTGKP